MPKSILDMIAGKGSVAGKLKEKREKLEKGESTHPVVGGGDNESDEVVRRGYFKDEDRYTKK